MPRGRALGYTLNLPDEDRYLKTREELIDYMTMLLGGRAAEQIVFGAVTTGASDDLRRASEVAGAMITDYAMGTTVVGHRPRRAQRRARLRADAAAARPGARGAAARGAHARRCGCSRSTAARSTRSPPSCSSQEVLERPAIERIVANAAPPRPRIAASTAREGDEAA